MTGKWSSRGAPDDEQLVAGYMRRLADATPDATRRTDPAVLWIKAQMLRRWEAERKAQAPLDLMEPVQIAACLAAAGVLLVWSLPSLLQAFRGLLPS